MEACKACIGEVQRSIANPPLFLQSPAQHGFKLRKNLGTTARKTGVGLRYGEGLYFSSVSGKANDYAQESTKV